MKDDALSIGIVPYLGYIDGAISEAIEGARRAHTRPCQHDGQAIFQPQGEPYSMGMERRWGIGLEVGSRRDV